MSFLTDYISLITEVLFAGVFGWIFFFIFLSALVYMLWWLKRDRNRNKFMDAVKWVFLEVKVDELNEKSPLAMEQIFAALHAIHQNFTWGEMLNGKVVLFVSCEIVSLGGKVSYVFKLPERYRNLLESALFAQYPKAEVHEVEDYLRNIPHHYDPEFAPFDFWGTQWLKKKVSEYPIRTYAQTESFEHSAQETFVDPLSNVIEVMSNLQPYELMAYQVIIKPVNDDWKEHARHLVKKLKGEPMEHGESIWGKILFTVPSLLLDALFSAFSGPADEKARPKTRADEPPPSLMLHKTDIEKFVITSIERSLGKISYEVRVRTLYLTPKDKLNKALRVPEIVGALRNFDDINLNGLKPDIGHSWTDKAYKISEKLEQPYLRMNILKRKRHMLHYFRVRSHWKGIGKVMMNTEELASIFHFPQVPHSRVSQLERVSAVKAAPPMDLPIK
ncbi:MAG: hypothetical protein A3B10_02110 [Candidatus Doudnabacteria bacterium RIFCSPLOWO2_01_FULL_44_21]|uniref:DUF8128 domain-containing protein n=1 Tax=Candidatus Doudnabacteria bacterium RIFCSPLOWO2_01_FULL_44_21 TaxID=1817841 RepID=A0A1F5Q5H0_9BACT|nr:MAG: hypothetical protein A3B95_00220 [Candidatus Doudnabacteria bacterium RIFCSPHIGHO2_02_FULL_43_13b]OGE97367.1 MAG: hypothetical protein A3B10_02110 [Candidatus Doudnabacteria bacterium RIFCSPLOWO2_01_FULL_44_21]